MILYIYYNILHISPTDPGYYTIVKPNVVITVNEQGDILTTGEIGSAQIFLKNAKTGMVKELIVYVHPPLKDSLNSNFMKKRLLFSYSEKDNQF